MPKQIQTPIVGQALQAAFGLQGRVVPALDEIIVPTVSLGEIFQNVPPSASRAVVFEGVQAPVAGEFPTFRLECPGNILLRIDGVFLRASTAGTVRFRFANVGGPQANTAAKSYTDGRLLDQNQAPAGVMTYGTQVAGIPLSGFITWAKTDGTMVTPKHWLIGSGRPDQFGFMEFQHRTANVQLDVAVLATEFQIV